MSDEEGYSSSDDDDYVPSDGEAVSEEENSGDEENLDALKEDGEPVVTTKRKRKTQNELTPRKRKGGIKLEGEAEAATEDNVNKELEEQIVKEKVEKKVELEKKKANDLWSSFMADVGRPGPKKTAASSSTSSSLSSLCKPVAATTKPTTKPEAKPKDSKIKVTTVYDFAGEAVQVTKELDVNSKEGKAELKRQKDEEEQKKRAPTAVPGPKPAGLLIGGGIKKAGAAGLGGLLDKINKKPKMGTLEKSKLDWETFKEKEGISEELKIHNRGKQSYIERMNFLQRTDQKQFEKERDLRLSNSSKR